MIPFGSSRFMAMLHIVLKIYLFIFRERQSTQVGVGVEGKKR